MSAEPSKNDPPPAGKEADPPEPNRPEKAPADAAHETKPLSSVSLSAAPPLGGAFAAMAAGVAQPAPSQAAAPPDDRVIDDGLIDRSLRGDSAAYGDLVKRYQDRLRASLYRVTGSAEEAEDVAQEAFVQAYLKLSTFQRSSRFYTWVYRIAVNQAISKNRKRRPRVSLNVVQEAGGPEPVAESDAPTQATLDGERAALLHDAIAGLEEDHRQVIVLREFDDLDYQQIAEVLGVPVGTVRSRLFRARAQLRERLGEALGET